MQRNIAFGRRNLEIKVRFADLDRAEKIAQELGAKLQAVENQRDTYFRVARGRLKLRERWVARSLSGTVQSDATQLIWYLRADQAGTRPSDYHLESVPHGEGLRELLTQALGVLGDVVKHRKIYMWDRVRIHLDQVQGLGSFLELEAIVDASCTEEDAGAKLDALRAALEITEEQLVGESYSDLIGQAPQGE